jgi:hypothetical protein
VTGRHQLELLDNAIDSMSEALAKYEQAKSGDVKAYKFCVLHLSHFLDLVLKHYVTLAHPLLIYRNPFAKNFDNESQTIGLQDAINFLRNEGRDLPDDFLDDLQWLKKLRNSIEHHKFDMDVVQVEAIIGRLIRAFVEFDQAHENLSLDDSIDLERYSLFLALADNYDLNLKKAENEVKLAIANNSDDSAFHIYHCHECDHDTLIPIEGAEDLYRCTFCGNETTPDEAEVACEICGVPWQRYFMDYCDWADDGQWIYICPRCRHDPEYVRDD